MSRRAPAGSGARTQRLGVFCDRGQRLAVRRHRDHLLTPVDDRASPRCRGRSKLPESRNARARRPALGSANPRVWKPSERRRIEASARPLASFTSPPLVSLALSGRGRRPREPRPSARARLRAPCRRRAGEVDPLPELLAVKGRRGDDLGLVGERDDPDAEGLRRVREEAQHRLLRGGEPVAGRPAPASSPRCRPRERTLARSSGASTVIVGRANPTASAASAASRSAAGTCRFQLRRLPATAASTSTFE